MSLRRTAWWLLPLTIALAACTPRTEEANASATEPAPVSGDAPMVGGAPAEDVGIGHPEYDGPAPRSLIEAGAVSDVAQEAKIRALLGDDDHALLVDTARLRFEDAAAPGLHTFAVRGLNTVMEAALQREGDAIRVGLIKGDEVRWYSNDPDTQSHPPAWFDGWRERFADKPVRLMSVDGQPLASPTKTPDGG